MTSSHCKVRNTFRCESHQVSSHFFCRWFRLVGLNAASDRLASIQRQWNVADDACGEEICIYKCADDTKIFVYTYIYIYINISNIYIYIYLYTYMQDMHSWLKFRSWQHCRICKRHLCHCWFQAPAMHVLRLQRQMFRKQTLRIGHCQSNISSQCCASHDCYHWRSRSAKADARTLNACAPKNKPIANLCVTIWLCYMSFLDVQKKRLFC